MTGQLRSLQALLRLGVLYAAVIFVGESVLISFRGGFWSLQLKTILCAAGLTPPVMASICFWLYDRRVLRPFRPRLLRLFQVAVVVLSFLPCFWIATRNAAFSQEQIRDLNQWAWALWLPAFGGIVASAILKLQKRRTFGTYLFDVFWRPLSVEGEEEPLLMMDERRIEADRAKQYSEKHAVAIFQRAYLGILTEAECAADLIASAYATAKGTTSTSSFTVNSREKLRSARDTLTLDALRVLDVGCATGTFTEKALGQLHGDGAVVERVVGIDPADFREEYRSKIQAQLGLRDDQVEYHRAKWQDVVLEANSNFNLVFFSHSLYEALDRNKGNAPGFWGAFQESSLLSALNEVSLWVVALACRSSRAYEFKRRFLRECYGRHQHDATFESFLRDIGPGLVDGLQSLGDANTIETFFVLPDNPEDRRFFGEYFLRCPIDDDAEPRYSELLHEYGVRLKNLHRLAAGAAQSQADEVDATLGGDAELLMHRTQVALYLYQKA